MNASNERRVEEATVGLLRATRANDAESAPARHSRQTDQCPNIARFAAVFKCGGMWTPAEAAHVLSCPFCLDVMRMFSTSSAATGAEDTVVSFDPGHETHIGLPQPKPGKSGKPPGDKPKPGPK
jgi:hypothetical protein